MKADTKMSLFLVLTAELVVCDYKRYVYVDPDDTYYSRTVYSNLDDKEAGDVHFRKSEMYRFNPFSSVPVVNEIPLFHDYRDYGASSLFGILPPLNIPLFGLFDTTTTTTAVTSTTVADLIGSTPQDSVVSEPQDSVVSEPQDSVVSEPQELPQDLVDPDVSDYEELLSNLDTESDISDDEGGEMELTMDGSDSDFLPFTDSSLDVSSGSLTDSSDTWSSDFLPLTDIRTPETLDFKAPKVTDVRKPETFDFKAPKVTDVKTPETLGPVLLDGDYVMEFNDPDADTAIFPEEIPFSDEGEQRNLQYGFGAGRYPGYGGFGGNAISMAESFGGNAISSANAMFGNAISSANSYGGNAISNANAYGGGTAISVANSY